MTGLDLDRDALIEVAALVTDSELNVLGDGVDVIIRPPAEALETMPEVVRQMHTSSGLLDELADGLTMAEAQERVLAYVREHVPEAGKTPLCGNSVATDRGFLGGLELEGEPGEVLSLLGPNGAGQTTTIEILEGYREATTGFVRVLGFDPSTHPRELRAIREAAGSRAALAALGLPHRIGRREPYAQ